MRGLASTAVVSLTHGNGVGCRPERNNHSPRPSKTFNLGLRTHEVVVGDFQRLSLKGVKFMQEAMV